MRLDARRIERRLQHEVVESLEDQQRTDDDDGRIPHGHAPDRGHDAHEDRNHAADKRPGIGHHVHHAHHQPDERRVGGFHPEGHHRQRHGDHQQQAFGEDSRKIARQQEGYGVERTGDVLVITFGEHRRNHSIEKSLVPQEEEGDEGDGENSDHGGEHDIDDRRKDRVERLDVDHLLEGRREGLREREGAFGHGEEFVQVALGAGYRFFDARHDGGEIDVRQLVDLIEDQRHEQRTQCRQHHPDDDQRRQRRQPAGHFPALDMQCREPFDQRIAHDGQHGRDQHIDDDRPEVPDQKEDGRSNRRARNKPQEGLGCRPHTSDELSFRKACDRSLRTHHRIADLDQQFAVLRNEHIDARPEFNEAADAVLLHRRTHFHIGDDTARDQACDLTEENLLSRSHLHHGRGAFVFGRGLGMPRHQKTARMVFEIFDGTAHGNPVHMDVGDGHEDRNLEHLLIQILVFLHDFGHDDAAVAGRKGEVGIVDAHAAGFPEKRDDKEQEPQQQHGAHPQQRNIRVADQQVIDQPPQKYANGAGNADNFVAFFIYSHNLI